MLPKSSEWGGGEEMRKPGWRSRSIAEHPPLWVDLLGIVKRNLELLHFPWSQTDPLLVSPSKPLCSRILLDAETTLSLKLVVDSRSLQYYSALSSDAPQRWILGCILPTEKCTCLLILDGDFWYPLVCWYTLQLSYCRKEPGRWWPWTVSWKASKALRIAVSCFQLENFSSSGVHLPWAQQVLRWAPEPQLLASGQYGCYA